MHVGLLAHVVNANGFAENPVIHRVRFRAPLRLRLRIARNTICVCFLICI